MCANVVVNLSQEKNMTHRALSPIVRHVKNAPKKENAKNAKSMGSKTSIKGSK